MTDVLPQRDCSLPAVCEPLERCCLGQLEEPGSKRPPNTGARLWGRVRSKLLRQKVLEGTGGGQKGGPEGLRGGWGWGPALPHSPCGAPFLRLPDCAVLGQSCDLHGGLLYLAGIW